VNIVKYELALLFTRDINPTVDYAVPNLGECLRSLCKLVKSCSWPHHSQEWQKVEAIVVWRLLYEHFHGNNPKI